MLLACNDCRQKVNAKILIWPWEYLQTTRFIWIWFVHKLKYMVIVYKGHHKMRTMYTNHTVHQCTMNVCKGVIELKCDKKFRRENFINKILREYKHLHNRPLYLLTKSYRYIFMLFTVWLHAYIQEKNVNVITIYNSDKFFRKKRRSDWFVRKEVVGRQMGRFCCS